MDPQQINVLSQATAVEKKKKPNVVLISVLVAVVVAIIAGGGVFYWKNLEVKNLEKQMADLSNRTDTLTQELGLANEQLTQSNLEIEELGCKGIWKEGEGCIQPKLVVLSPNGGETFCIGKENIIKWQSPSDMDSVNVGISSPEGASYNIGEFKAAQSIEGGVATGSIKWYGKGISGMSISPGEVYRIYVHGTYKGEQLEDRSDNVFTLKYCQ